MTDTTSAHADVNGAQLYYELAGAGHPLVFLHAGIANCQMWDASFPAFAEHYRVLRYDMRGYGRSPLPPGAYSHSNDLRALLDTLTIDRAHLVGCSQGGRVALEFALEHPDRVSALVLSGTGLRGYDYSDVITQYAEANDGAYEAGDLDLATELDMRMWVDGPKRRAEKVDPVFRERARAMARDVYKTPPDIATERPFAPPTVNRLWQIKARALVLVGEYDVPDMINIAGLVAFALDQAEKALIPGAGHLLPMELPDEFNRRALAFLAQAGDS
jgi:pimeloyl-ACP methyl ester carboxylesterase